MLYPTATSADSPLAHMVAHPLQLALVVLFHPPTGANTALALGQLALYGGGLCGGGLCGGGLCGGGLCGGGLCGSSCICGSGGIYIYIAHLLCGRCGGLNGAGAGPAQLCTGGLFLWPTSADTLLADVVGVIIL